MSEPAKYLTSAGSRPEPRMLVGPRRIVAAVSFAWEVSPGDITNTESKGTKTIQEARSACYLLCRWYTTRSLNEIAKATGRSDHTTVRTGYKRALVRLASDTEYRAKIDEAIRVLREGA